MHAAGTRVESYEAVSRERVGRQGPAVILSAGGLDDGAVLEADVAVVGGGPAGIVTALELGRAGVAVLLIESGGARFRPKVQRLADAAEWDPTRHSPMSVATRRQLGGTSVLWGGRCVPFDPVDFDRRDFISDAEWPVRYEELSAFLERACAWLDCGGAVFDANELPGLRGRKLVPDFPDGDVGASALERWSLPSNFGREYAGVLRRSADVRVITGLTCVRVVCTEQGSSVAWLETRTLDGKAIRVRADKYVLACGGLDTTRLLLASDGRHARGLGNHSGHLGRWYMAHVDGRIARVRFTTHPRETIYSYERDGDGVYVRRRFSFTREFLLKQRLPNVTAWLVNPGLADPSHHSGILSLAYLALSSPLGPYLASEQFRHTVTRRTSPGPRRAHLRNVLHAAGPTAAVAARLAYARVVARRGAPGFFVYSAANAYDLQYHAEHLPNRDSRVTLAEQRDALGMRRLRIDLRFSPQDVEGVVRAHRHLDAHLRRHGRGRLEYFSDDIEADVWRQANGGRHQLGTTRMSARAADGVVDGDLAVHGFDDLFVLSGSVFVTSGQATPTLMVIVFALRLADHLRATLGRSPRPLSS